MADIQIFDSPEFGSIRTLDDNGKVLFCAADVAKALGYEKARNAIATHCRYALKRGVPHPQAPDKTIEMSFIPEGDVIRLITHSKLPAAEKFEGWVFDEVLPQVLRTGSYSVAQPDPNLPPELAMVEGLLNSVKKLYMTQQEQTEELGKVKEQVNLMCEVSSTSVGDDWRTACTNAIRAVAFKRGGQKHYAEVWNEVYDEMKANGFDVRKRLDNRRKGALATGMHPTYVRKINALDVITDSKDKKLISGFISTVRKIAAAEGVKIAQKEEKSAAEQQYFDGMDDVEG